MSSKFDAYEVIGVIAPGSILLFGFALLFPDLKALFFAQGFSLGDLGLFLVLSFVAGHLIQALGNVLEMIVWTPLGGMPTTWLIKKPERLIQASQTDRLRQLMRTNFDCELAQAPAREWTPIVRELYAAVRAKGDTARIDAFNRTYGLMRAMTAALVLLAATTLIVSWPDWEAAAFVALAALLAGYRMIRFGKHYGRELVVMYLRAAAPEPPKPTDAPRSPSAS